MITKPLLFIFLITIISTNQIHFHYHNMDPKNSKIHMGIDEPCKNNGDSICMRLNKYCWDAPWYIHDHCVDREENGKKCNRNLMCKSLKCHNNKCVKYFYGR